MNTMKKIIFCLASAFVMCACTGGSSSQNAVDQEENDSILGVSDWDGSWDYVKSSVSDIYKEVTMGKESKEWLSKDFLDKEKRAREIDEMVVDWDYWIMAQDAENLKLEDVEVLDAAAERATAVVRIQNMGSDTRIRLYLVYEDGQWKVDDFLDLDAPEVTIKKQFTNCIEGKDREM